MTHIAAALPTFKRQRKRPKCPAAAVFKLIFEKERDNGMEIPKSRDEFF